MAIVHPNIDLICWGIMFIIIRLFQFLPKPGWLALKVQLIIKLPTLFMKLPTINPGKSNGLNEK